MREIFSVMSGFPVTIRLLDPPLHEFLPHEVWHFLCIRGCLGVWGLYYLNVHVYVGGWVGVTDE